jgi:putative endonuclease
MKLSKLSPPEVIKSNRGRASQARGLRAEATVAHRLERDGWQILARRELTEAGEIDLIATREGMLVFIEIKLRDNLANAAHALSRRQRARLLLAAEIWLGDNPGHGSVGVRFDVIVVDQTGEMRRIADAFRGGDL